MPPSVRGLAAVPSHLVNDRPSPPLLPGSGGGMQAPLPPLSYGGGGGSAASLLRSEFLSRVAGHGSRIVSGGVPKWYRCPGLRGDPPLWRPRIPAVCCSLLDSIVLTV